MSYTSNITKFINMRRAASEARVSFAKYERITKMYKAPQARAVLSAFFGASFFTVWATTWEEIKLINHGFPPAIWGFVRFEDEPPFDFNSEFEDLNKLWEAYYQFKNEEEIRDLAVSLTPHGGLVADDATDEAPVNPTEMITDHMDMDGSIHPKLDTFRFGYLCALLEQHGITHDGKYCYKKKDKKRNWAVAGHLVKEVSKSFGIKIQGGDFAWSLLCPFWGIPKESARRNSQYEGGDEERKSEINLIIAEALKSLPD